MPKKFQQTAADKKNAAEFLKALNVHTAKHGETKLTKFLRDEIAAGRTSAPKRMLPVKRSTARKPSIAGVLGAVTAAIIREVA